jgi:hypothetical protein
MVLTAFVVAAQQAMFGIPNPRGPFPPTHTPPRPPVELTLPKTAARLAARRRPHVPPSPRRLGKRHNSALHPIALPHLFKLLRSRRPRPPASQAENDGAQTLVLPKPALDFARTYRKSGFNQRGPGAYYARITLPLVIATQWRASMRAARAEAEYEALAYQVRDLFVELQADQARLSTLDKLLAELEQLNILVKARRGVGEQGKYDVWSIIDHASWRARRKEIAAETRDTASRLAVLVGDPMWEPEVVGEFKPLGLSTSTANDRDQFGIAAEVHAELTRKIRLLADQRAILDEYEPVLAGQIVDLRKLTEDVLRNGQVEFRDLADAVTARLELELAHINLVESVMHAEVAVLAASGRIEATEGG